MREAGGERTCAGEQRQRDGSRGGQSPHGGQGPPPPALPVLRPRHPDLLPDGSDPGYI